MTLPIANTFPLDLGVKKGFFADQGIEIKKTVVASGNDVILGLGGNNAEIGFGGFVPFMIGSTGGIPLQVLTASEVEGTSQADNWQNILVKGSSSIRTPGDLAGKTIAVNALKGVGEVMIKAAMQKIGVSPTSFRVTAIPFPQMRSALNNGQVDAIWTPEPFLSQALNIDHARIVMAPGPVLGKFFPIGGYAAKPSWISSHRSLASRFRIAMNKSLNYAQHAPAGDPRHAPGRHAERPPADLDDADQPDADPAARGLHAAVRRDHQGAEPEAADPGQHRQRLPHPGHGPADEGAPARRR